MIGDSREILREVIQNAAGVVAQWSVDAVPFTPPGETATVGAAFNPSIVAPTMAGLAGKTRLVLRVLSSSDLGADEPRRMYNAAHHQNDVTQSGIRMYSLSITCVSYGPTPPSETLELLRTRLQRSNFRKSMRAINVAIVDMLGIVDVPIAGSRVLEAGRQAVLDMKLAWAMNDALPPEDFIERARVTGLYP
jgi:hypothetical protein